MFLTKGSSSSLGQLINKASRADGHHTFSPWLVRNIVGVSLEKRREMGEIGSSGVQPHRPACQLTWWMNPFHITLMLSSCNWIIVTAQRHMGSDHPNPRWALDFCSQAFWVLTPQSISLCRAGYPELTTSTLPKPHTYGRVCRGFYSEWLL